MITTPGNNTTISHTTTNFETTTRAAITIVTTTRFLHLRRQHGIPEPSRSSNHTLPIILVSILILLIIFIIMYRKFMKKKEKRQSMILPTTNESLDPIIENILEEQDLKNQLRINAWRIAKLLKY